VAFDEGLAHRIREMIGDQLGLSERKMFGGLSEDEDLNGWMERGLAYAESLPPK